MSTEINYDNQEVTRNLPVLYTLPKWQVIVGFRNKRYFIPWTGQWTNRYHLEKLLRDLGYTLQDYYDRWILNRTVPSQRSKCINPRCGNLARFVSLERGYILICSNYRDGISDSCYNYQQDINRNSIETRRKRRKTRESKSEEEVRIIYDKVSASLRKFYENAGFKPSPPPYAHSRSASSRQRELSRLKRSLIMTESQNRPEVRDKIRESVRLSHLDESKYVSVNTEVGEIQGSPRGIKSTIISIFTNKKLYLDSNYELSFYRICTGDKSILEFDRCNFRIPYYVEEEIDGVSPGYHTYHPDFTIVRSNGVTEVVEVKPNRFFMSKLVVLKRNAAIQYCKEHHYAYYTVTENFLESHNEEDIYYHVREDDWI